METTVGKLLLKRRVPENLKSFVHDNTLDKKGIGSLFSKLSEGSSHQYRDVVTDLTRLGFEASTRQGSTVPLDDLSPLDDKDEQFAVLNKELDKIRSGPGSKRDKEIALINAYSEFTKKFEKALSDVGSKKNHTLAKVIKAGARGSMSQYRQTVGAPILVSDEKGRPMLDFPVEHSFAEGLTIPEYLAHSYGTRQGAIGTKLAIADSGYFCLAEDTLVRMADLSVKPIKDVAVGDLVLGANTEGGTFPVKVTATFDNGLRQVFEYCFRQGKSRSEFITITATAEHKVLAKIKRGKAKNSGKKILPLSRASKGFGLVPAAACEYLGDEEPYAHLIGVLLGDGCMTGKMPTLACADAELLTTLNEELASLNLEFSKINRKALSYEYALKSTSKVDFNRDTNGRVQSGHYLPVMKKLDELGLLNKKAAYKEIPEEVASWDKGSTAKLLAGLFETDGCISAIPNNPTPVIQYASTSKRLVEQVRMLLAIRFGVHCPAINCRKLTGKIVSGSEKAPNVKRHNHDCYSLVINNPESVRRFNEYIPLQGLKKHKLTSLLAAPCPTFQDNSFSLSYTGKKAVGEVRTYDLEVDHPDHLFVLANGAIVSNSKQLSRSSMPIKVEEHDCGTDNGMPVSTSDRESIGAYLAHPVGGYKKNDEITGGMLTTLNAKGTKSIVIRSPITCQSSRNHHNWAVCQMCIGKREKGTLPELDSYIGVTAGQALGEPLSQGQLNTKHNAGAASLGKTVATGFKLVEQLANPAQNFQNRAGVAAIDGTVTDLKKAPQGGFYIKIKGSNSTVEEYIPSGFDVHVKVGDKVEAGDVMSEGVINPADIVKHKGIGEGRRYYTKVMHNAFDEAGMGVNRRNFEIIAKGAIDHVRVTHPDGFGDYLPDAIVSYQGIEKNYKPSASSHTVKVDQALGKYLEAPVLHFTIGTKLSSGMINQLKEHKIQSVVVADVPPPFEPVMLRLLDVPGEVKDWAHQLNSSYLEKRLIRGVNEGISSNLKGPSPILGLSYGVGFGDKHGEAEVDEEEIH